MSFRKLFFLLLLLVTCCTCAGAQAAAKDHKNEQDGFPEIAEFDFEPGVEIFIATDSMLAELPLHDPAQANDVATLRQLIESGVSPKKCNNFGLCATHLAAQLGHTEAVALLLKHGADPFAVLKKVDHHKLRSGTPNVIDIADIPEITRTGGVTPAELATARGHLETVKVLFEAAQKTGHDLEQHIIDTMVAAMRRGHPEIIDFLLTLLPELHRYHGRLPGAYKPIFMFLGHKDDGTLTGKFLEHGLNANATFSGFRPETGANAMSLMHLAAIAGNVPLTTFLLWRYPNVNAFESMDDPQTPLYVALVSEHPEVADLLISNGADMAFADDEGTTCFWLAVNRNYVNLLKRYLERLPIDGQEWIVNQPAQNGMSPLHYAAQEGFKSQVELLLGHGADVGAIWPEHQLSVLQSAVMWNHAEVAKILIATKGAKVNHRYNMQDYTAAHLVTHNQYAESIFVLFSEPGVDLSLKDSEGRTPIDIAKQTWPTQTRKRFCDYILITQDMPTKRKSAIMQALCD